MMSEPILNEFVNKNMLDSVYNSKIIEYAGNIQNVGELDDADAKSRVHSKLCGSTVDVSLKMDGNIVSSFAHKVKACALGQAASSIMARVIEGSNAEELRDLRNIMYKMLKENGPAPTGKFEEFKFLEPVKEYKARHASTLLTFDAVVNCIDEIEAKQQASK